MRCSVVIPTFNRRAKLQACLKALLAQDYPSDAYEIIIVDDGGRDDSELAVSELGKSAKVLVRFLRQRHGGQGVARNLGIREARGELVVFLGDDIVATPDLLKEHDRVHRAHPQQNAAVLGFVTWLPMLSITPLMRFMEQGGAILGRFGGHQFAYDLLRGKRIADYRFFYTSNISLKRELLLKNMFDPWFSGYGWEDIELGYRLQKKSGMVLHYQPSAIAYHDHVMNELAFRDRMRAIGESSVRFQERYPELAIVPHDRKKAIFRLLSHPLFLFGARLLNRNIYFYALSKKYFLEGLARGYNQPQKTL